MKGIFLSLFILYSFFSQAQVIKGKVFRANSDTTVANAVIYYTGSIQGTITDAQGNFEFRAKQEKIPIIISCVGYYSSTVYYNRDELLFVHLFPKMEMLQTVTIHPNDMDRREEMAMFLQQFLGTSNNASSCTVLNLDDINLFFNRKTKILTALADKPIVIHNKKLGYTINYYLDKFEYQPKRLSFNGNYIFKEDFSPTDKDWLKICTRREDAYDGSRMQFIRAIWNHTLNKTAFKLYTPFFDRLTEDSIIVIDSLQRKYLHLGNRIIIANKNNLEQNSSLVANKGDTFIDKDGYFGEGLLWSGSIGMQRIGDLLPFEYHSEQENKKLAISDVADSPPVFLRKKETFADDLPYHKKMSEEEQNILIFKNMILSPLNAVNKELIVRKWQHPIQYKIYGSTNDENYDKEISRNVKKLFNIISANSNLSINAVTTDSLVNFKILIGRLVDFKQMLSKDAITYFENDPTRTCYYTLSENGFQDMVQFINIDIAINFININDGHLIWPQLRAELMTGLGFFGQLGYVSTNRTGLFYRNDDRSLNQNIRYLINILSSHYIIPRLRLV